MWNSNEMKYERLILLVWKKVDRNSDPFGLADADIYDSGIKTLDRNIMFSLEAGLRKLKNDFEINENGTQEKRDFIKNMINKFYEIKNEEDFDEVVDTVLKFIEK